MNVKRLKYDFTECMPFNAVKKLRPSKSDIGGLVSPDYFYAVTRELSEQTTLCRPLLMSRITLRISFSMPGSSKTDENTILVRHGSCS